jgi:hypothetical protein
MCSVKQPTSALIVIGYSFRDKHLNEVIVQGLQGNPTAIAFGLFFGTLAKHAPAVELAATRSNLNLFANDEAVIGTKRSAWTRGRDANASPRDTTAVKWVDDPAKNGLKNASFSLGDFDVFGTFLEELVGEKERAVVS